jgi:hypothetical protein
MIQRIPIPRLTAEIGFIAKRTTGNLSLTSNTEYNDA